MARRGPPSGSPREQGVEVRLRERERGRERGGGEERGRGEEDGEGERDVHKWIWESYYEVMGLSL